MQSYVTNMDKIDASLANHGYERRELIGVGPYSRVYSCLSVETGQLYALKIWDLSDSGAAMPPALERYWNRLYSTKSGKKLNFEGSLKIVANSRKWGFVITEFMPGVLSAELRAPADPWTIRQILESAIRGLIESHERQSSLHGEIKPSNLFLTESGQVVFGDSRRIPLLANGLIENRADLAIPAPHESRWAALEPGQVPAYPMGKYVAPELLNRNFGPVGKWADQYRLGMTIYELAMGDAFDSLFPGVGPDVIDSDLGWLRWQGSESEIPSPRQTLRQLDSCVQEVLHRLTRKMVTDRYRTLGQALELLDTGSRGENQAERTEPGQDIVSTGFASVPMNRERSESPHKESAIEWPPRQTISMHIDDWDEVPPEPWSYDWVKQKLDQRLSARRLVLAGLALVASALALAGVRDNRVYQGVRILVDPPDAAVFVDGTLIQGASPHEMQLAVGPHSIRTVHEDFEESRPVTYEIPRIEPVIQGEDKKTVQPVHEIRIEMQPLEASIAFEVTGYDMKPAKAELRVKLKDGESQESTTIDTGKPLRLPAGSRFAFSLNLPGYEPEHGEKLAQRQVDGRNQVISLKPRPKPRNVRVLSDYPDALVVQEDGSTLGTCERPLALEPRREPYRLAIRKENFFETKLAPFEVKPSETDMTLDAGKLRPLNENGVLEIITEPEHMEFTLKRVDVSDGAAIAGRGPKWRSEQLPKGSKWQVEAKLDRFRKICDTIEVSTGMNASKIVMELPPKFELANGMNFRHIPGQNMVVEIGRRPEARSIMDNSNVIRVDHSFDRFEYFRYVSRGSFIPPALVRVRPSQESDRPVGRSTPRKVHLNWGIYVCTTETTLKWYDEIMGVKPTLLLQHNEEWPVADISFDRAVAFLHALERKYDFAPGSLRFLTASENEYLASRVKPDRDNANLRTSQVGKPIATKSLRPDEFGLYDIVGNVAEFTWPESGEIHENDRVECLGGHYDQSQSTYYPAHRESLKRWSNSKHVGFRVVYDPIMARRPVELTDRGR